MTKAQKLVIGVPLGAILITAVIGWWASGQAERSYQEDLKKLRAMGIPTNGEELLKLDTGDPVTGEMYRDAITTMKALPDYQNKLVDDFGSWNSTTPEKDLVRLRTEVQPLFPLLEEAAARPTVSFERDWTQNFAVLFPEFADLKSFGKIMAAEARIRALEGDIEGTIIALETVDGIAQHSASEPALISSLVGIAVKRIGFYAKTAALQEFQNDPAALDRLQKLYDEPRPLQSFQQSLAGEVGMGVDFFESGQSFRYITSMDGSNVGDSGPMDLIADLPPVRTGVKRKFVKSWRSTFERLPDDPKDYYGVSETLRNVETEVDADTSLTGRLNSIFFPVFTQASEAFAGADASDNVARVGVRLLKQWKSTGKLPTNLSQFGDLAMDPCSGKTLIYKPTADGFTLYSIGHDKVDNGGVRVGNSYKDIVLEISKEK